MRSRRWLGVGLRLYAKGEWRRAPQRNVASLARARGCGVCGGAVSAARDCVPVRRVRINRKEWPRQSSPCNPGRCIPPVRADVRETSQGTRWSSDKTMPLAFRVLMN